MINTEYIRQLCSKNNMTLAQLAEKIPITANGLQRILNTGSTRPKTLERIAEIFDEPVKNFYETGFLPGEDLVQITADEYVGLKNAIEGFNDEIEAMQDHVKNIDLLNKIYLHHFEYLLLNFYPDQLTKIFNNSVINYLFEQRLIDNPTLESAWLKWNREKRISKTVDQGLTRDQRPTE